MALYEITDNRDGEKFLTEQPGPRAALGKVLEGRFTIKTIKTPMEAVLSIAVGAINLDAPEKLPLKDDYLDSPEFAEVD
jgi:hypothetical protein